MLHLPVRLVILLKKINSTLRGNIAAEIMAALRAGGLRHALIAPAVPRHGRIMRAGEVFIDAVPLRQTEIGSDAVIAAAFSAACRKS